MKHQFGAHVSTAGGIYTAPVRGEKLQCDAIQVFTKNQMRWKAKPISDEDAALFKKAFAESRANHVMTHDSYLINLGSKEDDKLEKSREAFLDEIQRCHQLDIPYLIFHPGSHTGAGERFALDRIAQSVNWAHESSKQTDVITLLEIAAGQGTNVGYTFEHLMDMIENITDKDRVGICLDIAHMFAAGYDMRTKSTYEATWKEFEQTIGLQWLKTFHINDSKKELGSKVDRHDNLGQGLIGLDAFRMLFNDERFSGIPMVLETPGGEKWYKKNLQLMRKLAGID